MGGSPKAVVKTSTLVGTALAILLILSATYGVSYVIFVSLGSALGHSPTFTLPLGVRLLGVALLVFGLATAADVTRFRRPMEIFVSTAVTFMKLVRRAPLAGKMGRTEPFVPRGPYEYVRSPMYFGVVTVPFGLGLAESSLVLLIWGVVLTAFYGLVLIPFEEKELEAMFGEPYLEYKRQVPMLFPYGRRYRKTNGAV
jgi:protein-S-isoprenylcysteine O-methyltransferase Ste14